MNVDEQEGNAGSDIVPNDHIGVVLRQHRIELGRELADIAHQTRIPLRHLTAIEEGLHDNLPALPYTVGFVKSYARTIGLDPAECAERFRAETTKTDRVTSTMTNEPIEDARVPTRRAAIIGIGLLVLLAIAVVGYAAGWFSGEEAPPVAAAPDTIGSAAGAPVAADDPAISLPPLAAEIPTAAADTAAGTAATPPVAAPAGGQVVIAAREDAWIKVYDRATGNAVFMGVMAAGDRYVVPADRQDLMLWTGRAGALDVTVGGAAIPPLGAPTETVKDVPLTAAALTSR